VVARAGLPDEEGPGENIEIDLSSNSVRLWEGAERKKEEEEHSERGTNMEKVEQNLALASSELEIF